LGGKRKEKEGQKVFFFGAKNVFFLFRVSLKFFLAVCLFFLSEEEEFCCCFTPF